MSDVHEGLQRLKEEFAIGEIKYSARDAVYALKLFIEKKSARVSIIQRGLCVGYERALKTRRYLDRLGLTDVEGKVYPSMLDFHFYFPDIATITEVSGIVKPLVWENVLSGTGGEMAKYFYEVSETPIFRIFVVSTHTGGYDIAVADFKGKYKVIGTVSGVPEAKLFAHNYYIDQIKSFFQ